MIDSQIYRTYDNSLRQARYDYLVAAAERGAEFVKGSGFDLKVTGSLSRGQVHPWSDLDLLLVRTDPEAVMSWDLSYGAEKAAQGNDHSNLIDVMFEEDLVGGLKVGILGSAVPISRLPSLGELPMKELSLPRCAMSLSFVIKAVLRDKQTTKSLIAERELSPEKDEHTIRTLWKSHQSISLNRLLDKAELALKRLAVFYDGGRSSFLDGDRSQETIVDLVTCLSKPSDLPFTRPPVLTNDAASLIAPLFNDLRHEIYIMEIDLGLEAVRIKQLLTAYVGWLRYLLTLTDLRQTHGLDQTV